MRRRYTKAELIKAGLFINLSPQVARTLKTTENSIHALREKYKGDPDFPVGGLYKICSNGKRSREEYLKNGLFRDRPKVVAERMGVSIQAVRWMVQEIRRRPQEVPPDLYKIRPQSKAESIPKEEWIRLGLFEKSALTIHKESGHSPAAISKARKRYEDNPDFLRRPGIGTRMKLIDRDELLKAIETCNNWEECYVVLKTCYRTFLRSVRIHKLEFQALGIKGSRMGRKRV